MVDINLEKYRAVKALVYCEDVKLIETVTKILTQEGKPKPFCIKSRYETIEGFGEHRNMTGWAKELGVPKVSMHRYLERGMTIEEIVKLRHIDYPKR